jgi:hypothetical protein
MRLPPHCFASLFLFGSFAVLLPCRHLAADEGMWLFNAVPTERLQQQYRFTSSAGWLEHLQKSSVRFDSGGSGSFVSRDGLVLTNQHVGADALQKLSDATHNYRHDGFYARTRSEEKRCLDLELNVLMSSEDVTARVNAAVRPEMSPEQAYLARQKVVAEIEQESQEKTGLRSDVVTLYEGGSSQLYRFKRYTDVRLVFAPEAQIAFYGGDPDNFEYPRYDLDICLFRVYENGQPAHITDYLKVSTAGPAEHELIFVSGHPGSTDREKTLSEFTDERDRALPRLLDVLYRREVLLGAYASQSPENARRSRDYLLEIQNTRKLCDGKLAGLLDPQRFAELANRENTLRSAFRNDSRFQPALSAYDRIESSQAVLARNAQRYELFETFYGDPTGFDSKLFQIARTLVRAAAERPKPNGERLPEFQETNRTSLELQLFSEAPIYDDLEKLTLADSLTYLIGQLGPGDPLARRYPLSRISLACIGAQPSMRVSHRLTCRPAGSSSATNSTPRRHLISSALPTSLAATAAARSSIGRESLSVLSSTGTSSRWCLTMATPAGKREPSLWILEPSSKRSPRSTRPTAWLRS